MERKSPETRRDPLPPAEVPPEEPAAAGGPEDLRGENERLWRAVDRYAPQIVDILAEHGDTEMLAAVAQRLSSAETNHPSTNNASSSAGDPIEELASEMAKQVVDFLFEPAQERPPARPPAHAESDQREAGRIEEYARQKSLRRGFVERGKPERREPNITLGDKGKEIAKAFGLSEEKLALAAADRLRRKGVLR